MIQIEQRQTNDHFTEPCPWADVDALKAAPGNHKIIFENEHVRVLEVAIAPHGKEPVHAHCWPSTLYVQQGGDIIDRDANGKILFDSRQLKVKPTFPFVQWAPPHTPHSDSARDWIEQHIGRDNGYQPYWPTIVIEHRYIGDIVRGIRNDGLAVF